VKYKHFANRHLLDHCYNGTNAATGTKGTKIDFVTYHWYADNAATGINGNVLNANNSAAAQKLVVNLLKSYRHLQARFLKMKWDRVMIR